MNKIEFLHRKLQTLPIPVQNVLFSDEKIEFCNLANKVQIRLNRDTFKVEYVDEQLEFFVIEAIISEFLSQYQSTERVITMAKYIYGFKEG